MTDQSLSAFVLFVRLNPAVGPTDPLIRRAFDAYAQLDDVPFVPGGPVPRPTFITPADVEYR